MSLRSLFVDLFSRAVGRRRRKDVARPSERKPQHGHESRRTRRMLGRPWVGTPMQWRRDGQLTRQRMVGDPATTGRLETSWQRKRRRRTAQRCRAGGHQLALLRLDEKHGTPVLGPCRCGEVRP